MKIMMKNNVGILKEVKVGFSWTSLLFGAFTPLFRGDWKWFIIQFIANITLPIISHIIFGFIYNKIYIESLLEKGYRPISDDGVEVLKAKRFISN